MKLHTREREGILRALRAGVVPRNGLEHLQVGRAAEIRALAEDMRHIAEDGGSTIRFLVGAYGAGKTFLLNLTRAIGREQGMVVLSAEMNPERRLHGRQGTARRLYADLAASAATKRRPEGNALDGILVRFADLAIDEGKVTGQGTAETVDRHLQDLRERPGGYSVHQVVHAYVAAHEEGDVARREAAIQWLRGEYRTVTEAREALGVRSIIDDATMQEHLGLLATLVHAAGYRGLLVTIDEMGALTDVRLRESRKQNHARILALLNAVHQGGLEHIGFVFAGTEDFVTDPRRGLYSEKGLATRLAENRFAEGGLVDYGHPILRLANLTREEMYGLLTRIRSVAEKGRAVPDEAIRTFMKHCSEHIGDAYFRTPRATITAFANLLATLDQNPGASWEGLLRSQTIARDDGDSPYGSPDAGGEPDGAGRYGLGEK